VGNKGGGMVITFHPVGEDCLGLKSDQQGTQNGGGKKANVSRQSRGGPRAEKIPIMRRKKGKYGAHEASKKGGVRAGGAQPVQPGRNGADAQ